MEYSFDINSETEKFELYYLKCICAGRAHEGLRANWQKQLGLFKMKSALNISAFTAFLMMKWQCSSNQNRNTN